MIEQVIDNQDKNGNRIYDVVKSYSQTDYEFQEKTSTIRNQNNDVVVYSGDLFIFAEFNYNTILRKNNKYYKIVWMQKSRLGRNHYKISEVPE